MRSTRGPRLGDEAVQREAQNKGTTKEIRKKKVTIIFHHHPSLSIIIHVLELDLWMLIFCHQEGTARGDLMALIQCLGVCKCIMMYLSIYAIMCPKVLTYLHNLTYFLNHLEASFQHVESLRPYFAHFDTLSSNFG